MSSEREFLNRIRAERDNLLPRLIYADWLDEQGDPRGEFICIQCELEQPQLPRGRSRLLRIREKELLKENRADWLRPLANPSTLNARWTFRRGFVEEVAIDTRDFLDLRRVLGEAFPLLHRLELREFTRELVERVAKSPVLEKFSSLHIPRNSIRGLDWRHEEYLRTLLNGPAARQLLGSRHLTNLESLNLRASEIRDDGLRAVLSCPDLRLDSLNLAWRSLDMDCVQYLAASQPLHTVRSLFLGFTNLDINHLMVLSYSDFLKNLEALDLRGNRLCSERNMVSLSALKRFPKLKRLDLRGCGVGNAGVETLVKSPLWRQFESLQLAKNQIQDQGLMAIASGRGTGNLASLDLQHNEIGNAGLIALANSPVLSSISHLHLEHNRLGTAGVVGLARTQHGERLRGLHLRGNREIEEPAGIALAAAPFPNLETLDLAGTQVGDQTSLALAESQTAFRLRALDLTKTHVRAAGAMALANSGSLKNLEILDLRMNHLKGDCVTALKEHFGNRVLV